MDEAQQRTELCNLLNCSLLLKEAGDTSYC